MAVPSNTFKSYEAVGNREDLSDVMYDLSPTEVPLLSALAKVKAKGTLHEWQTESLAAPNKSNFKLEGGDAETGPTSPSVRLSNYTAISDKVARVSGTQEGVDKAGRKSEMAHQMVKRMKELKRDIESILLANNAKVAGGDAVARECAGFQAYVTTNTSLGSTAVAATGDGSDAHTNGTARALTESMVTDVLGKCWENGGSPTMALMGRFQKEKFAGFSGNAQRQVDAKEKRVVNTVDVYIDPMGNEVRLVPDHFIDKDVVAFVDPEYAAFAVLRDFHTTPLAKTGDSERKQILVEYTLQMRNEKAHGLIRDLATA